MSEEVVDDGMSSVDVGGLESAGALENLGSG